MATSMEAGGGGAGGGGGAQVPQFYAGRELFITGASGFLGKVLVERLLATCPRVRRVHVLLRDKRGATSRQRLEDLKQSPAFDGVRERCPGQLDKLRVVSGDVSQPRLGLDASALQQLAQVSVVFHNAATIKFWESLRNAVHYNINSVIEIMDICDHLPKLEAFVYVSTAYSNAEHHHIEERVYAAPVRLDCLHAIVDALPPELLDEFTARFISPKPNTYTFSKAMAESVIAERPHRRYAAAIVRPSIVISAARHPRPGWVEGLAGPSGVVVGAGKGLLHAFPVSGAALADIVPVDITIDTMLAVAWEIATDKLELVRVYNSCSAERPVTWQQFRELVLRAARRHPLDGALYYPYTVAVGNTLLYKVVELVLQTTPLYIADFIARLSGVKLQLSLITASQRLRAMNSVLAFFATREWHFHTHNVQRLRDRLSPEDRQIYNLDVRTIEWETHIENFVRGARKYLLKEKDDNLPRARKHMARLRVLHYVILMLLTVLVCRFIIYLMSSCPRRWCSFSETTTNIIYT